VKIYPKSLAIHGLSLLNSFPTGATPPEQLRGLIERLAPWRTDKALIRVGPRGDGGYLVPDDLAGIEALFSPGVNEVSGFEMACAERGIQVFLADHSVDRPPDTHGLFRFTKKFIGVTTDDVFMTMDDWVDTSLPGSDGELLLQMDIEGFEYEAFLGMSDRLMRRFRIIVAEFHHLDELFGRHFFRFGSRTFEKILQTHDCVHIHPNNCCRLVSSRGVAIPRVAEFTFLRKDRIASRTRATDFPHPLDCDNHPNPSLPLPSCWYRQR
jgi:hypothetical protein